MLLNDNAFGAEIEWMKNVMLCFNLSIVFVLKPGVLHMDREV